MKQAAIYGRVSTGKQAAGDLSIPDQIKRCEDFAKARGFEIAQIFIDAGLSARTDNRPEFQRMITLASARHRPFDAVLVHSQSRFARNTKDLLTYKDQLDQHGVELISITQDLGTGDTADVLLTMVGAFDEYQSKETAKHVSRAMIENAKQGFWNGAYPPFGYRTYAAETRGARVKKKIEVDEHEAEIVRLIFRLYLRGDGTSGPIGMKRIADYLNTRGYVNQRFRVQFIGKVLRNTAYIGEHYFNRRDTRRKTIRPKEEWVPFTMPRLVADADFYAVQDKLDIQHPINTAPRLVSSNVLLTAIATCNECGGPMRKLTGKSGRYQYYRCARKSDAGAAVCKGSSIPMEELDEAVISALETKILAPQRLQKLTENLVARAADQTVFLSERRTQLDGDKRKAKAQVTKLYGLVGNGEIEMDVTLAAHIKVLQDKVETLTRQIAYLDQQRSLPVRALSNKQVEQFGRAVSTAIRDRSNPAFAKAYIKALVSNVSVGKEQIKISGPKVAPAMHAGHFAARGELVPGFAQEWRSGEDSNPRPLDS